MNWFKQRRVEKKALRVCDGVISITEREMLVQGVYITDVLNKKLREEGAICGGRKACLVGSMYLAHGDMPSEESAVAANPQTNTEWGGIFSHTEGRERYLEQRPGLKLAYDAFNRAAYNHMQSKYSLWLVDEDEREVWDDELEMYVDRVVEITEPGDGWGEWFFETVLRDRGSELVNHEIIEVAQMAKYLIRNRMVVA